MPTYDYYCETCGHEMEAFHSMSAEPLKDCPACGRPDLKRRIGTGAGLLFKGSGFYQTDYRSDSYKKGAKADDSTGKNSETKKKGSSDSSTSSTSGSTSTKTD